MKTKKSSLAKSVAVLLPLIMMVFSLISCGKAKEADASLKDKNSISAVAANDSVFVEVDKLAVYTGGDTAILNYLAKNIVYPSDAKTNGIQGKVIVKLVVEKDGSVSNVGILKSVSPSLDAEAVRVVSTLPKFESPAIKDGHPVAVHYVIPILFNLQ